jgi:hypothetical protein
MTSRLPQWLGLMVLLTVSPVSSQAVSTDEFRLETGFGFPLPKGMVEVCEGNVELQSLFRGGAPRSARLVGCFMTEEEWCKYPDVVDKSLPYASLLEIPGDSDVALRFQAMRKRLAENHKAYFAKLPEGTQRDYGTLEGAVVTLLDEGLRIRAGDVLPLGITLEHTNAVAWSMIRGMAAVPGADADKGHNSSTHSVNEFGMSIGFAANGRLYVLAAYQDLESTDDYVSLRRLVDGWFGRIVAGIEAPG